ncbi:MAG: hypothetical protein HZB50_06190 [Chloroflexi bacterium]|nr:hypothetical protein [Chloroflexota bacterium]
MERAVMCPQCNAPLTPHRFARSAICSYCGTTVQFDESSVSASTFHKAFRIWNNPESYSISSWISVGDNHWALGQLIARGRISDVYAGRRARWPTELAIVKILRDRQEITIFENEWKILQELQHSNASGADTFSTLLPRPISHGEIVNGLHAGRRISIFHWASGFHHTIDEVLKVYPQGINPQASIWMWRRILEVLSFLHNSGIAHGAVLPSHLLVQENEHGVRLVGYGSAGHFGEKLMNISDDFKPFYPKEKKFSLSLTAKLDLIMSARCIISILGGDPESASLPATVPDQLADIVKRIALADIVKEDAWAIREELGTLAQKIYGPPKFIPVAMPS